MPTETQTALVTGASQGLGGAIAAELARRGYGLVLTARNREALARAKADLEARYRVPVHVAPADLSRPADVDALVAACDALAPPVRVVVNNAGFGDTRVFVGREWPLLDEMLAVNVAALARLTHHFARAFAAAGGGRILNVASTAAFQPNPHFALYGATKAFVLSLSEAVAEELAGTGVTVTALCPGPTRTPFHDRAGSGGSLITRLSMMDADVVAAAGVDGMLAGRRVVVPGLANKALMQTVRVTPRALVPRIAKLFLRP